MNKAVPLKPLDPINNGSITETGTDSYRLAHTPRPGKPQKSTDAPGAHVPFGQHLGGPNHVRESQPQDCGIR
ncbi:hypothetical protein Aple_103680 [Acrocarpospora pleiomorpha]|uniref:Uncharacterized protein n=1 Tax=Acrocarpospora pleiomorpha TaxID=90975 RepID=A0A5M3Y704_9ACTN|nr:hypothetical protein Aple_103680 [Acrocarpospora pleiomorpha]